MREAQRYTLQLLPTIIIYREKFTVTRYSKHFIGANHTGSRYWEGPRCTDYRFNGLWGNETHGPHYSEEAHVAVIVVFMVYGRKMHRSPLQ